MSVLPILTLFFYSLSLLNVTNALSCFKISSLTAPKINCSIRDNVKDDEIAAEIYKANGIPKNSKKGTVYTAINFFTPITSGHAVCKYVLTRMEITSSLKSVEIIYDALIPANYKHANEISNNHFKLFGAKCNYGDGENDFLFVTDTKIKNYYYVFGRDLQITNSDGQLHLTIKACLKIVINKRTDFPVIKAVRETSDGLIAETILGKFSWLSSNLPRHICYFEAPVDRVSRICEIFRLKCKHPYCVSIQDSKCGEYQITTRNLKNLEKRLVNRNVKAAECQFKVVDSDIPKSILLFNTTKAQDHYYVAELFPGSVWHITSIVHLKL